MIDVRTDAGLREALLLLPDAGSWDSPLGRQIIGAVAVRARAVAARCGGAADIAMPDLAHALVGHAWEVLVTQREQIIGARSPWGVLYRAMGRIAKSEAHAADLLTSPTRVRNALAAAAHTATRLGDDPPPAPGRQANDSLPRKGADAWDEGLVALHRELVVAGADPSAAREAIASGLDVLNTTTRRSHLHMFAYRDPRLAGLLGRSGTSALMNLLIGSRREGPAGSAWLALRDAARAGRPAPLNATHPRSVPRVHAVARGLTATSQATLVPTAV